MRVKVILHRQDSEDITDTSVIEVIDEESVLDKVYEAMDERNLISYALGTGAIWRLKDYEILEDK